MTIQIIMVGGNWDAIAPSAIPTPRNIDKKSKQMISGIKYSPEDYSFEFGKNGEPFYMNGPYDHELIPTMLGK